MNKEQKTEELVSTLQEAADAYYLENEPIISDAEFDKKRRELEKLDPGHPFLKQVGSEIKTSPLKKTKHYLPMGSINNIFDIESFKSWIKGSTCLSPEILVQWKIDGLSVELVYKKGIFVQAITRGDGIIGEDVTHTISLAQGYPKKLKGCSSDVSIRVEAVLPIDLWKKHHSDMANPRNAASGIVRRKKPESAEHILLIAFDAAIHDNHNAWFTEKDKIIWMIDRGFVPVDSQLVGGNLNIVVPQMVSVLKTMETDREKLKFLTDGVVLKFNDTAIQNKLGEHDGRPKWAKAYKFAAVGEHTIVEDVVWQVGSSGHITPVACVKPVFVDGTTISRVTLHNVDEISRLGVTIGSVVELCRAGSVIPKVIRTVDVAYTCPECGFVGTLTQQRKYHDKKI